MACCTPIQPATPPMGKSYKKMKGGLNESPLGGYLPCELLKNSVDPVLRNRLAKFQKILNFYNRNCSFFVLLIYFSEQNCFAESGPKWTVLKVDGLSKNGRSWAKLDGLWRQSGRSWVKVDGHSTKSGRSLGINQSVEVDGPKVSNWTVRKCQTGRSRSVKVDGPKVSKWTVWECQSGRPESVEQNGPKMSNWSVQNC